MTTFIHQNIGVLFERKRAFEHLINNSQALLWFQGVGMLGLIFLIKPNPWNHAARI